MKTIPIALLGAILMPMALFAAAAPVEFKLICDRPLVESGKNETVLVKVLISGTELTVADRPPVNLSLVIDKSGSMSGDRIANARRGAIEAVRRMGRDDILSLVVFDRDVRTLIPAGRVQDLRDVERVIESIQAGGTTHIYGGLEAGRAELGKNVNRGYLNRLILLSDGLANVGKTDPEDFAKLGAAFSGDGIVVSTVGLGTAFNERLMAMLAQAGEGNHYFVHRPGDLPEIFESEVGNLVAMVARSVTITIELPRGVVLERVLGRPHRQEGRRVEIDFHDLAGGQDKYSVLQLNIPAGRTGDTLDALQGRAVYRNVGDDNRGEVAEHAAIRYATPAEASGQTVNEAVREAWAELRQAEVQEEVLRLAGEGRRVEAREQLARAPAEAEKLGLSSAARLLGDYRQREEDILTKRDYDGVEIRARQAEAYQMRNNQTTGRVVIEVKKDE